jgi:hypothetical protein
VENVAIIFCIGLVMFYLLLLIVLVVAPLLKQRKHKSPTRNREKEGMEDICAI